MGFGYIVSVSSAIWLGCSLALGEVWLPSHISKASTTSKRENPAGYWSKITLLGCFTTLSIAVTIYAYLNPK